MGFFLAGLQYLPPVEYFARACHAGTLVIEQHEHYQKRSWRNRTAILGPALPLMLTIPLVKGKNERQPIRDVRVSTDEDWARRHLQSIRSTYGKSPFFADVFGEIQPILRRGHSQLWDVNLELLEWAFGLLGLPVDIAFSKSFEAYVSPDTEDGRRGVRAGHTTLADARCPAYAQVLRLDRGFQPNLSILDVLCHFGSGSGQYVRTYAQALYG